jgi:hypothetical protein
VSGGRSSGQGATRPVTRQFTLLPG